jgi:protein-S-isoprenylcysteine O-methyltransferase Ste14
MEKKCELVRRMEVDELIDGIAGAVLTRLSSLPARCAPHGDLAIRRSIERVVFELRTDAREERMMLETFGDSYRAYMERTGKIFPSIR